MAKKGKLVQVEMTAAEAIDCCACAIEELTDEMTSWRDGMEEKLSHTEKYERVSDAASQLEDSDVRSHADEIESAISGLEGKPFKAGCPEHVVGTKCPRCKWHGVPRKASVEPQLRVLDKPTKSAFFGLDRMTVATVVTDGYCHAPFTVQEGATDAEIEDQKVAARSSFEVAHAEWVERNAPEKLIPARLPDEAEVPALEGLEEIGEVKAAWQELQPYKGRNLSRADRLSDATTAGKAGIEAMRAALDAYEEAHKDAMPEDADKRITTLRDALDELDGALDELDGVEFPGMYG